MTVFRRSPRKDPPALKTSYTHPDRGEHHFFRHALNPMRHRFAQLVDGQVPVVFLHGNPHLANYAHNGHGAAMVDFDRSLHGPYSWDLVRFLVSVALRRGDDIDDEPFLRHTVLDNVRRGYRFGLVCPDDGYEGMSHLEQRQPNKATRWAKRLSRFAADPDKKRMRHLLQSYLESQPDTKKLRKHYSVVKAARVPGSLGKLHNLFLLVPRRDGRDTLLIDVKETYPEDLQGLFENRFEHQGVRMVEAGRLYAPGWELRPGWATYKNEQYWGRQIPQRSEKIKRRLTEPEQMEIGYAVGTQLGRAHALSVEASGADVISEHLGHFWDDLVALAAQLRDELGRAHRRYLKKAA